MKFVKLILWIFRNVDEILENKFNNSIFNIKNYNAKMYSVCLKMCNLPVPSRLNKKQESVENHKKSINKNSTKLKNAKVQPILYTSYKFAV